MIFYNPVAGLTIDEAIIEACAKSRKNNDLVDANINDVHLFITPNAKASDFVKLYRKHLAFRQSHQKTR
nr:hypothetical protein [Candidatus Enterousia merdequi]